MRWYRRNDMDLEPNPDEPFRDDRLRDLVDELLDEDENYIVSRMFFGGAPFTTVSAEMNLSDYRAKEVLDRALARLREVLEAD